eukprot:Phypoly_transcript_10746.p1 GENE.Phypoly_transcript_10746~~Phypoly_transcript_10746.p1  ORF type:complete len:244 (-),score=59.42 Phypoly_transcript_10746:451-1182(-)
MAALSAKDKALFARLEKTSYYNQAKVFINAYWTKGIQPNCEEIWTLTQGYIRTDLHFKGLNPPNPSKEGTELDESGFHYFLEKNIHPLTVLEARAKLKEADVSFNGKVSLIEFLLYHFTKVPTEFTKICPEDIEGDINMTPEMAKAHNALNAARSEIQKIENEKERLEADIESGGGLKAAKAKNELAQLLSRDNTELNKALITAEAAVRKAGGSGKPAPPGTMWWMFREIEEMKKYKPKSKQG